MEFVPKYIVKFTVDGITLERYSNAHTPELVVEQIYGEFGICTYINSLDEVPLPARKVKEYYNNVIYVDFKSRKRVEKHA